MISLPRLIALILRIAINTECQLTISYYGGIRRLLILYFDSRAQNPPIEFKEVLFARLGL
jgi:hypothetical protein